MFFSYSPNLLFDRGSEGGVTVEGANQIFTMGLASPEPTAQ